jgi:hypothetical protein
MNLLECVTRRGEVDGRPVVVFDGLVDAAEITHLTGMLERSPFARTEGARPETRQFLHWVINLDPPVAHGLPIYAPSMAAAELVGGRRYRDYRSYCNYASFGDVLLSHVDAAPAAGEFTALWFLSAEWDLEWGGETLFFDKNRDAAFVVSPRPGRLAIFDGSILHCGRPPTRICHVPRFTFAYKLAPLPES